MSKCKSCGAPLESPADKCPSCGAAGGAETVTNIPAGIKEARRELFEEIKGARDRKEKMAEAECRSCGAKMYDDIDTCPSCGEAGGAETIPPAHIWRAHKQLKAEIKEIREEEKRKK